MNHYLATELRTVKVQQKKTKDRIQMSVDQNRKNEKRIKTLKISNNPQEPVIFAL